MSPSFFLVLVRGTMICVCKFTNMLHCYTCLCQEDRKEQSQGSAESSDPKAAASRVMRLMKASSWFVSLLFWGLATRAAASTQTDYAKCSGSSRAGLREGHALEVLQTVSGKTCDAIRQIKNACSS